MLQSFDHFLMFRNRLNKVFKHISKLARRQQVSCFRIYDHDLPQFPFLIELYENRLYVSEYKRQHSLNEDEHANWLSECRKIMSEVISMEPEGIFFRIRKRKENRLDQYQKRSDEKNEFIVEEGGLKFIVNLSDYLDTGLFLDHRLTRQLVRELSSGKKVLNLFCYTGSFSVYAIAGGAAEVSSVDLSKTYLDWAERNLKTNFPYFENHALIHADVLKYINDLAGESFDLIIIDPPTFSNSKRMDDFLDIQRDHVSLINKCLHILCKNGTLIFSTNYTKFQLESAIIDSPVIRNITAQTTPFDFKGKLKRHVIS